MDSKCDDWKQGPIPGLTLVEVVLVVVVAVLFEHLRDQELPPHLMWSLLT